MDDNYYTTENLPSGMVSSYFKYIQLIALHYDPVRVHQPSILYEKSGSERLNNYWLLTNLSMSQIPQSLFSGFCSILFFMFLSINIWMILWVCIQVQRKVNKNPIIIMLLQRGRQGTGLFQKVQFQPFHTELVWKLYDLIHLFVLDLESH